MADADGVHQPAASPPTDWRTIVPSTGDGVRVRLHVHENLGVTVGGFDVVGQRQCGINDYEFTYAPLDGQPTKKNGQLDLLRWLISSGTSLRFVTDSGTSCGWTPRGVAHQILTVRNQPTNLRAVRSLIAENPNLFPDGSAEVARLVRDVDLCLDAVNLLRDLKLRPGVIPTDAVTSPWMFLEAALGTTVDRSMREADSGVLFNKLLREVVTYFKHEHLSDTSKGEGPPLARMQGLPPISLDTATAAHVLVSRLADLNTLAFAGPWKKHQTTWQRLTGAADTTRANSYEKLCAMSAATFQRDATESVGRILDEAARRSAKASPFGAVSDEDLTSKIERLESAVVNKQELRIGVDAWWVGFRAQQVRDETDVRRRRIPSRRAAQRVLAKKFGPDAAVALDNPNVYLHFKSFMAFADAHDSMGPAETWQLFEEERLAGTETLYRGIGCPPEALRAIIEERGLESNWRRNLDPGEARDWREFSDLGRRLRSHVDSGTSNTPFLSMTVSALMAAGMGRASQAANGGGAYVFKLTVPRSSFLECTSRESVAIDSIPPEWIDEVRQLPDTFRYDPMFLLMPVDAFIDFFEGDLKPVDLERLEPEHSSG